MAMTNYRRPTALESKKTFLLILLTRAINYIPKDNFSLNVFL